VAEGLFVAGTDTGVGKTRAAQALIAAAVHKGKRAIGMKPIASGCRLSRDGLRSDDAQALIGVSNVDGDYIDINPYAFAPAVSPHLAARDAGVVIDLGRVRQCYGRLATRSDWIIVEGAGGWLTPISDDRTMADVATALRLPIVLVVGMRLGCLNHALLTHAAIDAIGLPFAGWIANRIDPHMERFEENLATLIRRLPGPLLAEFHHAPGEATESDMTQLATNLFRA
jgi:dethiobiotin synthetase